MDGIGIIGLFCFCFALTLAIPSETVDLRISMQTGRYNQDKNTAKPFHHQCLRLDDVNLNEFNLNIEDLTRLVQTHESQEEDNEDNGLLEDDNNRDIRTKATTVLLGSETNILIEPTTRKLSQIQKSCQSSAEENIVTSGSWNTTISVKTNAQAQFNANITISAQHFPSTATVKGTTSVGSSSSTRRHDATILETKMNTSSTTNLHIEFKPTLQLNEVVYVDANISSYASSRFRTKILSASCLKSDASSTFTATLAGQDWSNYITGRARSTVYSRVLYATMDGSSSIRTFVRTVAAVNIQIAHRNITESVVIKSFTETITRPIPLPNNNGEMTLAVVALNKIRLDTKSRLSKGYRLNSSGGEMSQSNSVVNIPRSAVLLDATEEEGHPIHHVILSENYAKAHLMRFQAQVEGAPNRIKTKSQFSVGD